eukprot:CAMPEP_0178786288 /NCGR_PEP_ID=MMETSP0745-20121128/5236_1 /TAXON_ID=913974 /ORGANISM="Nitzschia punctata, Strain CCMP561" /LENGTH=46 /DNA_ID= /DNA_START= /DNA_END= /DNA_ORIENTATION=
MGTLKYVEPSYPNAEDIKMHQNVMLLQVSHILATPDFFKNKIPSFV